MIQFKTENGAEYQARLETEFTNDIDSRLRAILLDLNFYTERMFGKSLIITCLNRTVAENERVGGNPNSAHLDRRAVDLRSRDFSEIVLDFIVKYLYDTWRKDFIYVLVHGQGFNKHIHINIRYKFRNN